MDAASGPTETYEGPPLRIAWLVSDHGWGHLNRSIVCMRALLDRGHAVTAVVAPSMREAIIQALPYATCATTPMDRGYQVERGGRGVNRALSIPLIEAVAQGPAPAAVSTILAGHPQIVVGDATPWTSVVAESGGVPSVLVSNFSWDDQYAAIAPDSPLLAPIRAMVAATTAGLELPFGSGLAGVRVRHAMPMISRTPSAGILPGLTLDKPFVVWAFGGTQADAQPLHALRDLAAIAQARGLALVADGAIAAYTGVDAVVPPPGTPWPDILAAAQLVVTKAGYSTIAETLRGAGHVLAIGITDLPEELAMLAQIEAIGHGAGISWGVANFAARFRNAVSLLLRRQARLPVRERGEQQVARTIEALAAT